MKHWILLFTPATYEMVKAKSLIGVRSNVWKRFSEGMDIGDRFISYVSQDIKFDGWGTITDEATFEERKVFHDDKWFPCRRKVKFEKICLNKSTGDLFHGVAPFNEVNTGPGNYFMCKGGFVEISAKDFDWLLTKIKAS